MFMKVTRSRLLCLAVGFAFGYLPLGAPLLAAQDECKAMTDAGGKVDNTPTHAYTTMKIGSTTVTTEMIYAAGSIYAKINGKWSVTESIKDVEKLKQENLRKNRDKDKATCRYLKDELANGEMAAVYSSHDESPKGKVDMQMWISKAKGLPLRIETDVDKVHTSTRYEYGDVKPPL
jgi:hypothetical protein